MTVKLRQLAIAGVAAVILSLGSPAAVAVEYDYDTYDYYGDYDAEYNEDGMYEDDWFYDSYDYNPGYNYDYNAENNYNADVDLFDWEEDGAFE